MIDLLISWLLARLLAQSFRRDATHTASVYPCRSLYPPLSCRALASKLTCAIMEMFATISMRTTSRHHWCAEGCVLVDSARTALPRVPHQGAAGNLFCPFLVRRSSSSFFFCHETTKRVPMEAMLHHCPSHGKGRHIRSVCKLPPVC